MLKKVEIVLSAICALFLLWIMVSFFEVNVAREMASNWNFFKILLNIGG